MHVRSIEELDDLQIEIAKVNVELSALRSRGADTSELESRFSELSSEWVDAAPRFLFSLEPDESDERAERQARRLKEIL